MPNKGLASSIFIFILVLNGCALNAINPTGTHSGLSGSCIDHLKTAHSGSPADIETSLQREYGEFILLSEKALSLREETINFGREIKVKFDSGKPLSGSDTATISKGLSNYLALRKNLLVIAESHECWLDQSEPELAQLGISPEQRYKGAMLSLASALILYDNYLFAMSLYEGDSRLRRALNENDPGYGLLSNELDKVALSYNSITNRARVRKAISYYESHTKDFNPVNSTPEYEYVRTLISQSPSLAMVNEWSPLHVIVSKIGFLQGVSVDSLLNLEKEGFNLFSMLFGNGIGLVESRRGLLYGHEEIKSAIVANLQAGDILLEKTPFRLTDKLIPGYWGHAALWIGNESELKQLGIWDDPLVVPYHKQITQGRSVVEALRSGVRMNSLDHFLNIDSIGVLRLTQQSPAEKKNAILLALRQVGKPYDFNFDVETRDRVYCSKLIYMSYTNVDWPTKKNLGRSTFTPDDVAYKAAYDQVFTLIVFYHAGEPVSELQLEKMSKLMGVERKKLTK